jgi:hypothetical protein
MSADHEQSLGQQFAAAIANLISLPLGQTWYRMATSVSVRHGPLCPPRRTHRRTAMIKRIGSLVQFLARRYLNPPRISWNLIRLAAVVTASIYLWKYT